MPIKTLSALFFISTVSMFYFSFNQKDSNTQLYHRHSKTYSVFEAHIKTIEKSNGYALLEGQVHINTDIKEFNFEWILPKDVHLIGGDTHGIVNTNNQKTYTFQIEIEWQNWQQKSFIFLHVNQNNIGKTALWTPQHKVKNDFQNKLNFLNLKSSHKKTKNTLPKHIKIMQ